MICQDTACEKLGAFLQVKTNFNIQSLLFAQKICDVQQNLPHQSIKTSTWAFFESLKQ